MDINRLLTFHNIALEVIREIERSEDKFGNQDAHPLFSHDLSSLTYSEQWSLPPAQGVKEYNDTVMASPTKLEHMSIVLEEFLEVVEAENTVDVRKELIQLACVAIKMVRALDSKAI